ncbi:MAG: helix-turn-helix domain-containing protein [Bacteroidales bacterium]|nr:helix-turn-helix domain-containing protein [Bacteroidales bacterium]
MQTKNKREILQRLNKIENLLKSSKDVLNFEEAAEFTGLSKSYLYQLTHKNLVPCYRPLGKQLRFSKAELEKWMLSNPVKTRPQIDKEARKHIIDNS